MKWKTFCQKLESGSKKLIKKVWRNKFLRRIIIGKCLFILALAVIFFIFNLAYQEKISPHTYIGSKNFGGLSRSEARSALDGLINQSKAQKINFYYNDKSYSVDQESLKIDYPAGQDKTLDQLLAVGRVGSLGKIIKETIKSVFSKNIVYASFGVNKTKLNAYLLEITNDVDKVEKDATIEIRSGQPVVIQEEIGQRFEISKNQQITLRHIGSFSFPEKMPFEIATIFPKIDSRIAEEAIPETLELINRQLILKAENKTFQIYPEDVAGMVEFVARLGKNNIVESGAKNIGLYSLSPEISKAKVYSLVEQIASEVYQEPRDPKFQVSGGRVVAFQLAQTGYELEKEEAVSRIINGLINDKKSLDLPVKVTEPTIASDDPEDIGLTELVAEGTTNFSGSPQNRRHNIAVGANAFDGVLIKPGEEFSMLKNLGPVGASTGYLPELVIKEDRTIPEYGGGLCQVSTTMFRAALNAGVKITERQNHSYRVRYYEPPVGMDATIYIPKPDFRFVNDYQSHLLIQTVISGNNLTFQFYGTKDGRRVETTDPYVYDVTGSGEPVYTESPDLAPGEIKRIESAHPGSKASFTYRVYDAYGKLKNEETFTSSYVPWPARYLYGPGTTIPPVEEGE